MAPTLSKLRARVLQTLQAASPRDTAESVAWTAELRADVRAYLATYKRAVETADEGSPLRDLLLMDTMSLGVRRSNHIINAVVLSPSIPSDWPGSSTTMN